MLRKTHLAIGLAFGLYFLPHVNNKFIFLPVVLIATLLPDIDSGFGFFGKRFLSKPIQMMSGHRGFIHSYTICLLATLAFAFFYPLLALPFFLGYSSHLIADSFTVRGIKPFWPLRYAASGKVVTGGKIEDVVFWVFVLVDIFLLLMFFI